MERNVQVNLEYFHPKNLVKRLYLLILSSIICFLFAGCGKSETYAMPYGSITSNDKYTISEVDSQMQIPLFASDLCASENDITASSSIDPSSIYAAGVYDINDKETLYSYQANIVVNPASLTKVMTVLLALEYGDINAQVAVGDVRINEDGVQLFGLQEGDVISLGDLLYVSLLYSGNDASLAIAKYIGGSEDAFVEMMNRKAQELGATHTNFDNPHGLTNDNHYTTAYDLYLIFNEAMQYEEFRTIINTASYTFTYQKANGESVTKTITTTNKYLTGDYDMPNKIAIWGGKTGSTSAAGKCIIVYAIDSYNNPYICVVMGASDEGTLYQTMRQLCEDTIP